MMDNFKKKEEKNTLENPESQPKIVRRKKHIIASVAMVTSVKK